MEEPSNHVTSLSMAAPHVLPTDQRAGPAPLGEGSGRPSPTAGVRSACCVGQRLLLLQTQGQATSPRASLGPWPETAPPSEDHTQRKPCQALPAGNSDQQLCFQSQITQGKNTHHGILQNKASELWVRRSPACVASAPFPSTMGRHQRCTRQKSSTGAPQGMFPTWRPRHPKCAQAGAPQWRGQLTG